MSSGEHVITSHDGKSKVLDEDEMRAFDAAVQQLKIEQDTYAHEISHLENLLRVAKTRYDDVTTKAVRVTVARAKTEPVDVEILPHHHGELFGTEKKGKLAVTCKPPTPPPKNDEPEDPPEPSTTSLHSSQGISSGEEKGFDKTQYCSSQDLNEVKIRAKVLKGVTDLFNKDWTVSIPRGMGSRYEALVAGRAKIGAIDQDLWLTLGRPVSMVFTAGSVEKSLLALWEHKDERAIDANLKSNTVGRYLDVFKKN